MIYRMLLSYSKYVCVCVCVRVCVCVWTKKGWELKVSGENILESLEGMDLLEERNPDTPYSGTRARMDGIYSEQGLNTGLSSLCMGGNGENITPQMQVHSPDLFCFLFLNMKE